MDFIRRIPSSSVKIKERKTDPSFFLENGRDLLSEFVTQWNGRSKIPIRNFSAQELAKALNNFDVNNVLRQGNYYRMYRGYFGKRPILVKKYRSWRIFKYDMVISSQMSVHKGVLKVIGCCLDFEYPALVYQCPEASDLNPGLFYTEELKLTWENRLRIASDIANVVAYLHSAFRTPIIHRYLKLDHVVIDRYGSAKISDFSFCIWIRLGESRVGLEESRVALEPSVGSYGHVNPDLIATGILNVKTDVYDMGLILVELLTGKNPRYIKYREENVSSLFEFLRSYTENDKVKDIVNSDVVMEGKAGQDEQFRAFAALALRCLETDRNDRPEMVDVVKELRQIQGLGCSSSSS